MRKPLIGISCSVKEGKLNLGVAYYNSIQRAGGIPVALPPDTSPSDFMFFDGFLLSGGGDVSPSFYGREKEEKCGEPNLSLDEFELGLARFAYNKNIPLLGICRGIQVMNVAFGGTLIQHIENHVQQTPRNVCEFETSVTPDTLLYDILGKERIFVNSFHHQAIDKQAPGFIPCAFSVPGNTVESAYAPDKRFCLGVQWHPECLSGCDSDKIFRALVSAAM